MSAITKIDITVKEINKGEKFEIDICTFPKQIPLVSLIAYLTLALNQTINGSIEEDEE